MPVKFAWPTQRVLDLIQEIDKKRLSEKHRGRLLARIEELTNSLCTNDYPEENLQRRVARSEANFRVAQFYLLAIQ